DCTAANGRGLPLRRRSEAHRRRIVVAGAISIAQVVYEIIVTGADRHRAASYGFGSRAEGRASLGIVEGVTRVGELANGSAVVPLGFCAISDRGRLLGRSSASPGGSHLRVRPAGERIRTGSRVSPA